ncbi:respiratory nitrate reductase subunit gamma [Hyalangium gracile]|uniref:respiratory nitrate reductase subunit gamma n=1 Tax=Hyalangium gracile TaxID=394092 RepID=UPI001CCE2EBC|nr:respiratory nitrate reductase subunit gamma [Hyalangium gracile]
MSATFLYVYLPYAALLACAVGVTRRLQTAGARARKAEPRPWAPGTLALVVGAGIVALNHVAGWVLPGAMRAFHSSPPRLFAFEAVSLIGGMLLTWGLVQVLVRRMREGQASWGLRTVYALLLLQCVCGLVMAVGVRWGALWSLDVVTPYLRSLLFLKPDATLILQAPAVLRLHLLLGFALLAVAPFIQARRASEPVAATTPEEPLLASRKQETATRAES